MKRAAPCGTVTVHIDGVLDSRSVASALARVAELSCDDVVLDLGAAREISDVAVASLARELARFPRWHVIVRGLAPQHERVLERLGAGSLIERDGTTHR
jgi:hypothetical protein